MASIRRADLTGHSPDRSSTSADNQREAAIAREVLSLSLSLSLAPGALADDADRARLKAALLQLVPLDA